MTIRPFFLFYLARFCVLLALVVILLGAYTRLKDAGLGCPDWPGCYGEWILPKSNEALSTLQANFPSVPLETKKAWTEMVHRYFAGTLGFAILILSTWAVISARQYAFSRWLPTTLLGVVIFQALLGMWTVTLKLLPVVVMGHLLGGFACITLLWWLSLHLNPNSTVKWSPPSPRLQAFTLFAISLLILQIILGAWTSANYAALVCTHFPGCNQAFWPYFDWQAFNLTGAQALERPIDFMSYPARVTIHMMHRLGAFLNVIVLSILIFKTWRSFKCTAQVLMGLLILQIILGITNVLKMLPLHVAVSHNGIAALLLLTVFTLWYQQRIHLRGNHA